MNIKQEKIFFLYTEIRIEENEWKLSDVPALIRTCISEDMKCMEDTKRNMVLYKDMAY